ncbi:MAG: VOC family protein, partial [Pseudomonadota bacterium]
MLKTNAFNWVTIPVSDMERAMGFYGKVFDLDLTAEAMPSGDVMAMLPRDETGH